MKFLQHALPILPLAFLFSCTEKGTENKSDARSGPPVIHAVNYPLAYFAERIGGDRIDVQFLPGNGDGDPAFWKPEDGEIAAMQEADLILLNGATYAKWRESVSLPQSILADTSKAFSGEYIATETAVNHSHGKDGEHSHAGTAFTTWMDLQQAVWQGEEVLYALTDLLPEHQSEFERRFQQLATEIDLLHARFKEIGATLEGQPFLASHPVYQYFARRYGLDIEAVLWEPETVPDDGAMKDLREILEEHGAGWMIWEGEPAPASVAKLEAIGIKSLVVDPCGNRPDEGDWLAVMRQNAENLAAAVP